MARYNSGDEEGDWEMDLLDESDPHVSLLTKGNRGETESARTETVKRILTRLKQRAGLDQLQRQVSRKTIIRGLTIVMTALFLSLCWFLFGINRLLWPSVAQDVPDRTPTTLDPETINVQDACPGYKASNVVDTDDGLTAVLTLAGKPCNTYGKDIEKLNVTVQYQDAGRLAISITPAYLDASNSSSYIVPEHLLRRPSLDKSRENAENDSDLEFSWSNDPTFSFTVTRKSTQDIVFSTKETVLVYENQFIEFVSTMPANYNVYGLGERMHGLRLGDDFTATMYNADSACPLDRNIYGTHPFYVDTRFHEIVQGQTDGDLLLHATDDLDPDAQYLSYSHGVYLRNAHAQEVRLNKENVIWRTLGGSIDLFFFDGPNAVDVTAQYQRAIGLPAMQQYWALGYHQSRWGYHNWSDLEDVVDKMRQNGIPLETIWTDIDYMQNYRVFTTDKDSFAVPAGQEFLDELHNKGQHYVPIIDAGIYHPDPKNESDVYASFDRGNAVDAFIRNLNGSLYVGQVWPGFTVWPDLHSQKGIDWWVDEFTRFQKDIDFDGIWIDMNEAASGCNGSCGSAERSSIPSKASFPELSNGRDLEYPPYVINNIAGELWGSTIAPSAIHPSSNIQEYDVHNLFGYGLLNATYTALSTINPRKRPFIIGRSTFAGSGSVAGHWGGDNFSEWFYLYFSIPQALSMSLFGIPMFGTDACGFGGNTTEELCNRWMMLGAFMPFFRNHNTLKANSQEPYLWPSVAEASRTSLSIRYTLLPYLYTLMQRAHTDGSTVLRALGWEFPNDPSLVAADRQFLLGPSLLVTPVLVEGATSVDGVFPGSPDTPWYDWYTGAREKVGKWENKTLEAPLGFIPLHVRGGSVLALQAPGYTTTESRQNDWSILVTLDKDGLAKGELYLDDGESVDPSDTLEVTFEVVAGDTAKLIVTRKGSFIDSNTLANITIMGVKNWSGTATLDDEDVSSVGTFNASVDVLKFTGPRQVAQEAAWAKDWVLEWK